MGGDVNKMMSELMGKADGYCKGKGGSLHIADLVRQSHEARKKAKELLDEAKQKVEKMIEEG